MKIKNICPVIGMISSGKSSILNALFNMDYLEATPEVTTKIVTIIRYNPSVTKPKFFKLILKKDENNNYTFYKKNDSEIIGKDNIRTKVKNLNNELKQKDPKYEDIFYMLEIGEVNFIEKEFLKTNDLADVPGVSEYMQEDLKKSQNNCAAPNPNMGADNSTQSVEELMNNTKFLSEINYLTEIFKIMKNKMNNGIFIFSVDKFQLTENYKIVGKLKLVLNKPIENFLLLLNKMDKSENIEEDIKILNERFVEEFPNGGFNVTRNTIVQCSSFQLENELKMEKEFSKLIYYHYINYIMDTNNNNNFIEYFKNFIRNYIKKEVENIDPEEFKENIKSIENDEDIKKIKDIIERIKKNHDTTKKKLLLDEKDFTEENIQSCIDDLDNLIEDDDGKINLVDQTNNTIIILYYYYLYKNKKIKLFRSSETKTILEYFTIQNINRKFTYKEMESKLKEFDNNKDTVNKKINYVISKLKDLFEIYKNGEIYLNQIDNVKNSLKPIINNLKTSQFFYIPLIGVYNSGKSTILNDIIGYDLLPVKTGECTKKGILIAHWDYDIPIIRKAKFICENTGDKNDICYFELNNDVIAEGDVNVKKILNGVNGNFIDKEEDFFYIINVKIQFLDFFNDNTIKEKICFVDLPGYGTKNKFETKDIYSKFIKSCKLFLMVARDHFEDKENVEKINGLLEKTSKYQGISTQALVKKILFIINNSQNMDTSEQSLQKKKNSLIKNINGLTENVNKDINITFFNGVSYQYYLEKKYLFSNLTYLFNFVRQNHLKDYESFLKGFKQNCERKFENYFTRFLKDNLKTIYSINANKIDIEIDKKISDSIDLFIAKNKYSFKEKDIVEIKKIITYCKDNIEQCKYINDSNFLNFRFYLYARIMICKYESDNDLRKLIENKLDNLDKIFYNEENLEVGMVPVYKEITNDSKVKLEQFKINLDNKIKDFIIDKSTNDVPKILYDSIFKVNDVLKNLKNDIDGKLKQKKKWKEIQDEFENALQTTVQNQKTLIIDTLEKCSYQVKTHSNEAFKMINEFKTNPEDNYKFDELKIYISNKLGEKNDYKEAIDNIVNDIIANSRTSTNWKNSSGLFDFLKSKFSDKAYLNKTIEFMISDALDRLNSFRINIANLIEQYLSDILNKILTEKINIVNILTEKIRMKEIENMEIEKENQLEKEKYEKFKKELEEKNKKWKEICQEYNTNKILINNIFTEPEINLETSTGNEIPTPQ